MSFMGEIETRCPHGCDPFSTPVWSFVNAVKTPELRDTIKALELNLLLCPGCDKAFAPEATWIYYEPALEILAFVFPESFKADEPKWRSKMEEDYAVLRESLGGDLPVSTPPEIFFGQQGLADLLEFEDFRGDERDVMAHYAEDLGLSLYKASPAWAREHGAPNVLPYKGKIATRESVLAGIQDLLVANDRLTAWADYRQALAAEPAAPLPPPAA